MSVSLEAVERRWWMLNRIFTERDNLGPDSGPRWTIEARPSQLLLTAVHGVWHRRPGVGLKANDANTGGLVRVLAETLGSSGAWVLRAVDEPSDANADATHPFKDALVSAGVVSPGSVVLDMHGMTASAGVDIAMGFGEDLPSANLAQRLAAVVEAHGLRVDLGGRHTGLTAAGDGTMAAWAQHLGALAVQIEIARRWRSFKSPVSDRIRLLAALREGAIAELGHAR